MKYKFSRKSEDDLIVVTTYLKVYRKSTYYPLSLVLDTGASHTVIDLNMLLVAGYSKSLKLNKEVKIQTANKIIDADKMIVEELKILDKSTMNFEITTYDFLAQDDLLDYDGVLGLDFFQGTKLNIDFIKSAFTVLWPKNI
jgi:Aspartyl protease